VSKQRKTSGAPSSTDGRTQLGPIRPEELYPLAVLKQRLGWGDAALRRARRDGLKVTRYGNLHCIVGSDLIEFIKKQA